MGFSFGGTGTGGDSAPGNAPLDTAAINALIESRLGQLTSHHSTLHVETGAQFTGFSGHWDTQASPPSGALHTMDWSAATFAATGEATLILETLGSDSTKLLPRRAFRGELFFVCTYNNETDANSPQVQVQIKVNGNVLPASVNLQNYNTAASERDHLPLQSNVVRVELETTDEITIELINRSVDNVEPDSGDLRDFYLHVWEDVGAPSIAQDTLFNLLGLTLLQGANITLTPDATNNRYTISSPDPGVSLDTVGALLATLDIFDYNATTNVLTYNAPDTDDSGITLDQARDAAGALLATLDEFDYNAETNVLTYTPPEGTGSVAVRAGVVSSRTTLNALQATGHDVIMAYVDTAFDSYEVGDTLLWDTSGDQGGDTWVVVGKRGAGDGTSTPTNLALTRAATSVTVTSDTGTDAQIPAASTSEAGVMTAANAVKLAGVEANATRDQSAAEIRALGFNYYSILPAGNVYRATATGVVPARPDNSSGTVTATGVTVAPANWSLTQPDPTSSAQDVYVAHAYYIVEDGAASQVYGQPNQIDRYVTDRPGGAIFTTSHTSISAESDVTNIAFSVLSPSGAPVVGDYVYSTTQKHLYRITAVNTGSSTFNAAFEADLNQAAGGTTVTANPSGSDGSDLNRIAIDGTNYNIPTAPQNSGVTLGQVNTAIQQSLQQSTVTRNDQTEVQLDASGGGSHTSVKTITGLSTAERGSLTGGAHLDMDVVIDHNSGSGDYDFSIQAEQGGNVVSGPFQLTLPPVRGSHTVPVRFPLSDDSQITIRVTLVATGQQNVDYTLTNIKIYIEGVLHDDVEELAEGVFAREGGRLRSDLDTQIEGKLDKDDQVHGVAMQWNGNFVTTATGATATPAGRQRFTDNDGQPTVFNRVSIVADEGSFEIGFDRVPTLLGRRLVVSLAGTEVFDGNITATQLNTSDAFLSLADQAPADDPANGSAVSLTIYGPGGANTGVDSTAVNALIDVAVEKASVDKTPATASHNITLAAEADQTVTFAIPALTSADRDGVTGNAEIEFEIRTAISSGNNNFDAQVSVAQGGAALGDGAMHLPAPADDGTITTPIRLPTTDDTAITVSYAIVAGGAVSVTASIQNVRWVIVGALADDVTEAAKGAATREDAKVVRELKELIDEIDLANIPAPAPPEYARIEGPAFCPAPAVFLRTLDFTNTASILGAIAHDGTNWYVGVRSGTTGLFTLDPKTGALGTKLGSSAWRTLAADPATGDMWGIYSGDTVRTIDKTDGSSTALPNDLDITGGTSTGAQKLAWNPDNSTLYALSVGIATSRIATVDTATGAATVLYALSGLDSGYYAYAYFITGNVHYTLAQHPTGSTQHWKLYSIDISDGSCTEIFEYYMENDAASANARLDTEFEDVGVNFSAGNDGLEIIAATDTNITDTTDKASLHWLCVNLDHGITADATLARTWSGIDEPHLARGRLIFNDDFEVGGDYTWATKNADGTFTLDKGLYIARVEAKLRNSGEGEDNAISRFAGWPEIHVGSTIYADTPPYARGSLIGSSGINFANYPTPRAVFSGLVRINADDTVVDVMGAGEWNQMPAGSSEVKRFVQGQVSMELTRLSPAADIRTLIHSWALASSMGPIPAEFLGQAGDTGPTGDVGANFSFVALGRFANAAQAIAAPVTYDGTSVPQVSGTWQTTGVPSGTDPLYVAYVDGSRNAGEDNWTWVWTIVLADFLPEYSATGNGGWSTTVPDPYVGFIRFRTTSGQWFGPIPISPQVRTWMDVPLTAHLNSAVDSFATQQLVSNAANPIDLRQYQWVNLGVQLWKNGIIQAEPRNLIIPASDIVSTSAPNVMVEHLFVKLNKAGYGFVGRAHHSNDTPEGTGDDWEGRWARIQFLNASGRDRQPHAIRVLEAGGSGSGVSLRCKPRFLR